MLKLLALLFIFTLSLNTFASVDCSIEKSKIKVVGETEVPTWNPKLKKTMLMSIPYAQFTSPFPDFVQFKIKEKEGCEKIKIKSVQIYRQFGPQDWIKNNKSAKESDHSAHQKPNDILTWEKKAFKSLKVSLAEKENEIIIKSIPIEEALEAHKVNEHIWALKFKIDYDLGSSKKSHEFVMEAPLIH